MALSWLVPTTTVGNAFSVTLVSDTAVTGVNPGDFRLRAADGTTILLTDSLVTITQVAGTHNWRLDISLSGTHNQRYSIRLRRRQLQENGTRVPADVLDSTTFLIDSSHVVQPPTGELSIEVIDEQFIVVGTTDYDLVIDIGGNPDRVVARGHMEGFFQDWDAAKGQLHIKSEDVTREISGVNWDIEAVKGMETLIGQVAYNVIKAAPILETLPMLHLYRDVPIRFDVSIKNIPNIILPNSQLIGVKSELTTSGVNFGGELPADANFGLQQDNVRIMIPSETEETSAMHDYPYVIESGSPPAIGTPEFTPRGNFGKLTFTDVKHTLGYEWTLQEGDAAEWNFFSDTRPVMDPSEIEVTPGHLQVAITFPNIPGAASYAYQLESETHNVNWVEFTGTLSNNMITTIIPDLEEGTAYTLRLRVASPWVGTPTSIKVYGGRFAYAIAGNTTPREFIQFHTGVANGGTAPVLKKITLPSRLLHCQGLVVEGDLAWTLTAGPQIFDWRNTAEGQEAQITRRHGLTGFVDRHPRSLALTDDRIYFLRRTTYRGNRNNYFVITEKNVADGVSLTPLWAGNQTPTSGSIDVIGNVLFNLFNDVLSGYPIQGDTILTRTSVRFNMPRGRLSVVGDTFYVLTPENTLGVFRRNPSDLGESTVINQFGMPAGFGDGRGLFVDRS